MGARAGAGYLDNAETRESLIELARNASIGGDHCCFTLPLLAAAIQAQGKLGRGGAAEPTLCGVF